MYLLMILLNKEEYLDDLLSCLLELGIEHASILDTQSMSTVLATQIPIFASLRLSPRHSKAYSKTILAVGESTKVAEDLLRLLKSVGIDTQQDIRIIVMKAEEVIGSMEDLDMA
jgi:nitrogen regulatory protein P-II 1